MAFVRLDEDNTDKALGQRGEVYKLVTLTIIRRKEKEVIKNNLTSEAEK